MRLLNRFLFCRKSQLPNAGDGLFTNKKIEKYQIICCYDGPHITNKQWKISGWNVNLLQIDENTCIDGKNCQARKINDANGISKKVGCNNNCRFIIENKKAFIVATRDIEKGEELFVGYGENYWIDYCKYMEGTKEI